MMTEAIDTAIALADMQAETKRVRQGVDELRRKFRETMEARLIGLRVQRHGNVYEITRAYIDQHCHISVDGVRVNKAGKKGTRQMHIGFLSLCKPATE